MKYFAVIDTNVFVSALLSARAQKISNPMKVIIHMFSGDVKPVYNGDILEEYKDVLCRQKFHFDPEMVEKVIREIQRIGINIQGIETEEYFPDPDDAVFFEVAIAHKEKEDNTYLVTLCSS